MKNILATQIKAAATKEENQVLYERVASGDKAARDEMIERNMALVFEKVNSFVATHRNIRYLQDDLVSSGTIGLVKAVDAMAADGGCSRDPVGCICGSIIHTMSDLFETESPINVSRRVRKRPTSQPVPTRETFNPEKIQSRDSETVELFDLRDQIQSCCWCDQDRSIIRLREEGHTQDEIAALIGVPSGSIYYYIQAIKDRFEEIEKNSETRPAPRTL